MGGGGGGTWRELQAGEKQRESVFKYVHVHIFQILYICMGG